MGLSSLWKPVFTDKLYASRVDVLHPSLVLLPPPAWLKSAVKVVRGDFSGVGSTLGGSAVFQQGSDPAQTHLCGFSLSPDKAGSVCVPERAPQHWGDPRVAPAPGQPSAIPALGNMDVVVGKIPWMLKTFPVPWGSLPTSTLCTPDSLHRSVGGGGLCPHGLPKEPIHHPHPPASISPSPALFSHPCSPLGL